MMKSEELEELYNHVPEELRRKVVELNDSFERIGPFELPIELLSGKVIFFTVNH